MENLQFRPFQKFKVLHTFDTNNLVSLVCPRSQYHPFCWHILLKHALSKFHFPLDILHHGIQDTTFIRLPTDVVPGFLCQSGQSWALLFTRRLNYMCRAFLQYGKRRHSTNVVIFWALLFTRRLNCMCRAFLQYSKRRHSTNVVIFCTTWKIFEKFTKLLFPL